MPNHLLLPLLAVPVLALAAPPPMSQVSLKQTLALLSAKQSLTPAEREAQTLLELGLNVLGLDRVSVPLGMTNEKLASAPDTIFNRVNWDLWAACNRLTPAQKEAVVALLPRLDRSRAMAVAWAQLNTGQIAEARLAMVARIDQLLAGPAAWPSVHEAKQLLTCVGPHLAASEVTQRRTRLDQLSASLPRIPPG